MVAAGVVGGVASMGGLPVIGFPGQSVAPVAVASTAPGGSALPSTTPATSPLASLAATSSPIASPPAPSASLDPCAPPPNATLARVLSHGDFDRKEVALTFDDGTNPENTKQILGILVREKVNATFFPTGIAMERFPEVWRAVAQDNFPIGNHTYGHGELKGKCYEAQRRELAHAADVFVRLGIEEAPYMRPPYELWDRTTEAAAAAEGLGAVVLWNYDTGDWQGASARTIARIALSGGKGAIVLMHTFPEATAAALPTIIKGFKERGYTFVTIGQMLGIEGPVPYPPKA